MTANFKHINASEQIFDGTITASLLAPTAAVLSVNSDSNPNLTGNVQLVSGSHITLSQVGQTITVSATGELSTALTNSHIFVGNVSNVATDVAVSGDLTLTNTGAFTVANNAITNVKIATGTFSHITGLGVQTQALDMGQNQILNLVLQKGTSEPISPVEGELFYRTDTHQAELWNGTAWVLIG